MGIPGAIRACRCRRMLAALALAALSTATAAGVAPGAPDSGSLEGRLTDWRSVPLAQAVVTVRNLATGATMRGTTGKNGSYHFSGLGPGEYRLEADVPELGKGAVEGILVSAGHATRVQAALVMELPVQSPSAEAGSSQIDPVMPAVTTLMPTEELDAIPVRSRDWQQIAAITPAGNPLPQGGGNDLANSAEEEGGASLSMEGRTGFRTASSIDGMDTTPGFRTDNSRGNRGGPGGQSAGESAGVSAVQAVEARSGNSPADLNSSPGGAIDLITDRGRDGFHGQAFYFSRDSVWGAMNPFTQWVRETAPASGIAIAQFSPLPYTPANRRQTVGLGVGRQIRRDKAFWFAAVDGLLRNDPAVATVRHADDFFARPTDPELTVLAARLGLASLDPVDEAVAAYSSGLEGLGGLLGPVPRNSTQWQGFTRIDWQLTERQHLSTEGQAAYEKAPAGALGRSSETYGSHSFGDSQATDAWGIAKLDSFFTANLLNAVNAQFRRHLQSDTPQAPSAFEAPLIANAWGELPEIIADSKYGFILGKPARLGHSKYPDERLFAAQDTLSWVRGAHLVKVGGSFDHIADKVNSLINQTGTYSYADVLNFVSDTASFTRYGFGDVQNPDANQHNCDATGRVHKEGQTLAGLGYLPCYAWYTQRIGPADWHLSTNDLAAFSTEQWQPAHNLTISAGVRLEVEQLPSPIAGIANADLPATTRLPYTALKWGPRFGVAWVPWQRTVLRAGAGLYFGRIDNSTLLAALTLTGSLHGDLNFFFKPTDVGAPPFPYVFPEAPQTAVTPGAVSFAPNFRQQQVDQAVFSLEQELPSHWIVSVSALASLGRHLPISIDTNLAQSTNPNQQSITYDVVDALGAGPIKSPKITVPLYTVRTNSSYQQLDWIESRANSTYDAAMIKIVRNGGHGLTLHAHYLYAHATDWNPNESANVAVNDLLDPQDFRREYGSSNLDIRHSAGAVVLYTTQWKLYGWAGTLANTWSLAVVGQFRSGLPYTMRTSGYIPADYQAELAGGRTLLEGVGPGMNGSGGDNRIYGIGSDNHAYNIGRNTYRYPATWTGDTRLTKRFNLAHNRQLELLAESFNLFNHQNVTLLETTGYSIERGSTSGGPATLNFLTGLKTGTVEFGKPIDVNATNFYHPREIQLGIRARF